MEYIQKKSVKLIFWFHEFFCELTAESRQFMFSGVNNFCTRVKWPFLAASSNAESPRNKSKISWSPSLTYNSGKIGGIKNNDWYSSFPFPDYSLILFFFMWNLLTKSIGVWPSRFFLVGSAPCLSKSLTISYLPFAEPF